MISRLKYFNKIVLFLVEYILIDKYFFYLTFYHFDMFYEEILIF